MRKKINLNYKVLMVLFLLVGLGAIILGMDNYKVQRGKSVFQEQGCVGCHAVHEISDSTVGPSLDGLADRAGNRVGGLSAEGYIQRSIIDPDAYVVEEWSPICNPTSFVETMTESDLNNLVTWLLTLATE